MGDLTVVLGEDQQVIEANAAVAVEIRLFPGRAAGRVIVLREDQQVVEVDRAVTVGVPEDGRRGQGVAEGGAVGLTVPEYDLSGIVEAILKVEKADRRAEQGVAGGDDFVA